jgi:cell wall-associated NlpC family hydrolase
LRKNVVDYALQQKGTRYKYAGRTPRTGFDCSGFTYYVFDAFDVTLTPVSRAQENEGKRVNLDDAQTGDLIFFRKNKTGAVFHVALVVRQRPGELMVVHSTSSRGVIMENIYDSSYWRTKAMSARDVISR